MTNNIIEVPIGVDGCRTSDTKRMLYPIRASFKKSISIHTNACAPLAPSHNKRAYLDFKSTGTRETSSVMTPQGKGNRFLHIVCGYR